MFNCPKRLGLFGNWGKGYLGRILPFYWRINFPLVLGGQEDFSRLLRLLKAHFPSKRYLGDLGPFGRNLWQTQRSLFQSLIGAIPSLPLFISSCRVTFEIPKVNSGGNSMGGAFFLLNQGRGFTTRAKLRTATFGRTSEFGAIFPTINFHSDSFWPNKGRIGPFLQRHWVIGSHSSSIGVGPTWFKWQG